MGTCGLCVFLGVCLQSQLDAEFLSFPLPAAFFASGPCFLKFTPHQLAASTLFVFPGRGPGLGCSSVFCPTLGTLSLLALEYLAAFACGSRLII